MRHPAHLLAKRDQARWLAGHQVVIAQAVACHADGRIDPPLAGAGSVPGS
jgi:hypothetical protein